MCPSRVQAMLGDRGGGGAFESIFTEARRRGWLVRRWQGTYWSIRLFPCGNRGVWETPRGLLGDECFVFALVWAGCSQVR